MCFFLILKAKKIKLTHCLTSDLSKIRKPYLIFRFTIRSATKELYLNLTTIQKSKKKKRTLSQKSPF